ncbi:uncharacterized protein SCHCODRAFT_02485650 [Schizophyllum commune H4-8]|nr:uncharacterized protein SCHCODRAFT_02485650 [Schizophyllum commune H4-8]KAI5900824.1 hypothetical protein SCHCODRAFT_02485650 [Schizophyllum commune H4-8]
MRRSARLSSRTSQRPQNLDGDSSEVSLPPPKRRKTKASASSASVKGKLAALFELPLDILYEILCNTHPNDLLQISRATKTLRRTLMSRSSIWIWQRSYAAHPDLPTVPEDLNIPQFMSLAVDRWCHSCHGKCADAICWTARTRSCRNCLRNTKHWFRREQMRSKPALRIIGESNLIFQSVMMSLFPYIRITVPSRPSGQVYYLASSVRDFLEKFDRDDVAHMTAAQRDRWLTPTYGEMERLAEHARECEQWVQRLKKRQGG